MHRDHYNDGDPAAAGAQSALQLQVAVVSLLVTKLKLSQELGSAPNNIHHLTPLDSIPDDEPHPRSADPIPRQSLEEYAQGVPKENLESKG